MKRAAAVVACLLAVGGVAGATPKDEAREHAARATTHYKLGRFQEALDEYGKAYELLPSPAALFNIGQCYFFMKNYERAVFFFEGFLRDDPHTPNRALVNGLIGDARRELAREQEVRDLALAEARRAAVAPAVTPRKTVVASAPPTRPRPPVLMWSGVAAAAFGLAVVATGIYFGAHARSQSDAVTALAQQQGTWSAAFRDTERDGAASARTANILLVVGGVLAIAGGVVGVIGWRRRALERVALEPERGGASLAVRCAF